MDGWLMPLLYICYILMSILESVGSQYVTDYPYSGDELDCPDENATYFGEVPSKVPWGIPYRAYKTVPKGLAISPSYIEDAGYGIISETFIQRNTWLGEYEGETVPPEEKEEISWYAWTAHRDGYTTHYVDALNIETSTYIRWINCARNRKEENVVVAECKGKILYVTIKDIYPGTELLVYYGSSYGEELGNVNIEEFDY